MTLHIVSYKSGKPALAAAATTLLQQYNDRIDKSTTHDPSRPTIQELNAILEG